MKYFIILILCLVFLGKYDISHAQIETRLIQLELTGFDTRDSYTSTDNAIQIYFHPNARNGWDIYDASKLNPLGGRYAILALLGDRLGEEREKSQDSRPYYFAENVAIPTRSSYLQMFGNFTLGIRQLVNIPEHWEINLRDVIADSVHNLRLSDYEFNYFISTGEVEQEERFEILLETNSAFTKPDSLQNSGWWLGGLQASGVSAVNLSQWGWVQGINGLPHANGAPNLYATYDGQQWISAHLETEFSPGKGFLWYVFENEDYVLDYHDLTPVYRDVTVPLHTDGDSWNLLANPFPYPLAWDEISLPVGQLESHIAAIWDSELQTYRLSTDLNNLIPVGSALFVKNDTATDIIFPQSAQRMESENSETLLHEISDQNSKIRIISHSYDMHGNQTGADYATNVILADVQSFNHVRFEAPPVISSEALQWVITGSDDVSYAQYVVHPAHNFEIRLNRAHIPRESVVATLNLTGNPQLGINWPYLSIPELDIKNFRWSEIAEEGLFVPAEIEALTLLFSSEAIVGLETNIAAPTSFTLLQNYPNPFNPSTLIPYTLAVAANISITVYDVAGRELQRLFQGQQDAGHHHIVWDASRFSSGVYIIRMKVGTETVSRRSVTLVK